MMNSVGWLAADYALVVVALEDFYSDGLPEITGQIGSIGRKAHLLEDSIAFSVGILSFTG